jgi:HEAT repeat protein
MVLDVMKRGSRIARLACLDALTKSSDTRVTEALEAATHGVDLQIAKKAEIILHKREGLKVWQTALEDDSESLMSASTAQIWNIKQERKAFEQLGSQEMEKTLSILRDDNQNNRLRAILRRVNEGRPVVESLILILKNKDEEIKRRAVEAIDRLEDISGNPLMVAINDNDPFIRAVAARNLGKLGWMDAILPLLDHACEDKDAFVQGTASEAITRMGMHPDLKMPVADALIRALTDDSTGIRLKSAEILGNLGAAVAVPHLVNLFRDRDSAVQNSAAEALAEIGKAAFPALAQAASDPDPRTRRGSLTALAEFGKKGETYLNEALNDNNPDIREHAKKILYAQKHGEELRETKRAGIAGLPPDPAAGGTCRTDLPAKKKTAPDPAACIAQLVSTDKKVRARAIKSLSSMGEPGFRSLVIAAYQPDAAMRIGALQALSHFGTLGAPHVLNALEDPEVEVQHAAYRILNHLDGKYGLPHVGGPALTVGTPPEILLRNESSPTRVHKRLPVPVEKIYPADIIPYLADPGEIARKRAVKVLAEMGDVAFLPLVYAAYHPNAVMRIGALQALSRFGTRGAPFIIRGIADPELEVQHTVYQILKDLDGRYGLPRVGGPFFSAVIPLQPDGGDAGPAASEAPAISLDGITDPQELVDLLDHSSKEVQINAAMALAMMGGKAVPALIGAFTHKNKDVRGTAAEIIGSLGPDAFESLIHALEDPRSDVVSGSASVLGKLGDTRAVPVLISLLDRNQNNTGIIAAEALGYLGDVASVEALIRALNGSDSELQSGAARALGYIGDKRAVSSLIDAMGSADFSLRQIAIDALTGIGKPSLPYLSQALLHHDRGVRSGAVECLTQMGYVPESEQETINLLVANEDWPELTRKGESAVPVLVSFVNDADVDVRVEALTVLGKIGGNVAVSSLTRYLLDEDPRVRRKVMGSLVEMGGTALPSLESVRETVADPALKQVIDQVLEKIQGKTAAKTSRD